MKALFVTLLALFTVLPCSAVTNWLSILSLNARRLAWSNGTAATFPSAITDATYQVQMTTNLLINSNTWTVLPGFGSVPGTGAVTSVTLPATLETRFYRVRWSNPVLADSPLDFSNTQGSNNWYYGYFEGAFASSAFKAMTVFATNTWYVNPTAYWTRIDNNGFHPNGTITSGGKTNVEQWAVRRWVSTAAGSVELIGTISDASPTCGNGVIVHIFVDGVQQNAYTIANGGQTNFQFSVNVDAGSWIDFALDPRSSDDRCDATIMKVTIRR